MLLLTLHKIQNGIRAEDWHACVQATQVQVVLPNSYKHIFLLFSHEAKQLDEDNH